MFDELQTVALLMLTLSHLILQWRCQEYTNKSNNHSNWIQSVITDFQDGMNEIGAILEDISDGFDSAQNSTKKQSASAPIMDILSQAVISNLNPMIGHASKTEEWPVREEGNNDPPKEI